LGCQKATKERFENFLSVVSQLCGKIQTFKQQSLIFGINIKPH